MQNFALSHVGLQNSSCTTMTSCTVTSLPDSFLITHVVSLSSAIGNTSWGFPMSKKVFTLTIWAVYDIKFVLYFSDKSFSTRPMLDDLFEVAAHRSLGRTPPNKLTIIHNNLFINFVCNFESVKGFLLPLLQWGLEEFEKTSKQTKNKTLSTIWAKNNNNKTLETKTKQNKKQNK